MLCSVLIIPSSCRLESLNPPFSKVDKPLFFQRERKSLSLFKGKTKHFLFRKEPNLSLPKGKKRRILKRKSKKDSPFSLITYFHASIASRSPSAVYLPEVFTSNNASLNSFSNSSLLFPMTLGFAHDVEYRFPITSLRDRDTVR